MAVVVMIMVVVVVSRRLDPEGSVHATRDSAGSTADRRADDSADRTGCVAASVTPHRSPLLGTTYNSLSLSNRRQGQESQSGSQRQNTNGHGSLLR